MIKSITWSPNVSNSMKNQINFGAKKDAIVKLPDDVKLAGQEIFDGIVRHPFSDEGNRVGLKYIAKILLPKLQKNYNLSGDELVTNLGFNNNRGVMSSVIKRNPKLTGTDFINGLNESLADFLF